MILVQNGFDTNDRIQDIWSGISLKGGEPVNIKNIILGCLVWQISVFNGRQAYHLCGFLCIFVFYTAVIHDFLEHLFIDFSNETFQTHNAAFSCFKRLAIFTIHGSKSHKGKFCIFIYHIGFFRTAEHLDKMQFLTLVYHINDFIRMEIFHTLYNGSQICSIIKGCPVWFQNHARRDFLGVRFFFYIHN